MKRKNSSGKTLLAKSAIEVDSTVEVLVRQIIERVADKWTMLVLEVLEEHGTVRFTRLGEFVGGISQTAERDVHGKHRSA